ncbi:carboxypeptidase-like regulatory domain-containing protein [Owenweeksia hongkongensis]|uniref:carboxypeptidase-like regulatory domain-containing protein n=1 Tax=Owenweeksia hongkongensis TaxID=253245 RepID=UPI003A945604
MRFKIILGIFALCLATSDVWAQQFKEPVQMSGIVLSGDAEPQFMPYVNIVVKKRKRGAATNSEGFFSFAVLPGDTLLFSSIGFRTETLVIPDTLDEKEYLSRVIMNRDTTMLQEVTLYPWPTPEQFKEEFLATRVPTTEEDIAMRNLAIQELKARAAKMGYSAAEIQDYVIAAKNAEIYNYGRYNNYSGGGTAILGSLSNPFAWAQFFEALKRGDFDSDSSR